jgi:hypothetical protein
LILRGQSLDGPDDLKIGSLRRSYLEQTPPGSRRVLVPIANPIRPGVHRIFTLIIYIFESNKRGGLPTTATLKFKTPGGGYELDWKVKRSEG